MLHVMDRLEDLLNENDDASDAGGSAPLESVVESAPVDDIIVDEDAMVDHTLLGVRGQEREWYVAGVLIPTCVVPRVLIPT